MKIHPTAIVSPKATIAEGVIVGPYSIIHDNVVLGAGTEIQSFCELGVTNGISGGELLKIGQDSLIRSHSVFYEGSVFGDGLVTGHRVTVREKTLAGKNLQIGTLSDIQGDCQIGDYVRFHSNVHIGQKSEIGNFVWIFPYVVLTNDPHPPSETLIGAKVHDFAVIATMSVVLPGAEIQEGCLIGAHSSIKGTTEPDTVYAGSPAKKICPTSRIKLTDGSGVAYPWRKHFKRGYPEDVIKEWGEIGCDLGE
ncbi:MULTISPECIES: N-acetyltransferase [unclassified Marinobacter]|uniref:N-acetyltransferase n=1 Tax=unclassified Marinobacter TaxID=83889 RepID=UPI001267FF79|nr:MULTISPECIES: N-acetyltransferase [unclassified Marinobacter]QFS87731.1 Acyl-[acyl-carrier-protein]--UDP-N-acetylglucosamine O-acyltransferase [Marinobacter sp. THAF197a]QFT51516.1 Acyl-[acyl-carrier-protein]--UDP-N-acetylglucosamine O-acyltransferase [Marinobacter sp. THAF39]